MGKKYDVAIIGGGPQALLQEFMQLEQASQLQLSSVDL